MITIGMSPIAINPVGRVFLLFWVGVLLSAGVLRACTAWKRRTARAEPKGAAVAPVPTVEKPPAPVRPRAVVVVETRMRVKCPVCQGRIEPSSISIECERCGTACHDDCWDFVNRCSLYGCGGTRGCPVTGKASIASSSES